MERQALDQRLDELSAAIRVIRIPPQERLSLECDESCLEVASDELGVSKERLCELMVAAVSDAKLQRSRRRVRIGVKGGNRNEKADRHHSFLVLRICDERQRLGASLGFSRSSGRTASGPLVRGCGAACNALYGAAPPPNTIANWIADFRSGKLRAVEGDITF